MANTNKRTMKTDDDIQLLKKHVAMPEPSGVLAGKIMMDAENTLKPGLTKILWPFGPVWKPAGVLTAAMALGVMVGFTVLPFEAQDISAEIDIMISG